MGFRSMQSGIARSQALAKQREQDEYLANLNKQVDAMRRAQTHMTSVDKMGYNRMGGGANEHGIEKGAFTMLRDKDGNLNKRFQETLDPSLAKLRDKYDVEGDTKWAGLQRDQLANQMSEAEDRARLQSNTGMATAMDRLSMRGGLRGGAGERMAMGNQRALMSGLQGLGAENRAGNLKLSIADEEMKNKVLGQVGQAGQGIQGRNIGRLATDVQNQNQFEAQRYSDDMAAYGAKQTAKAQRSASGGCFLGNTQIMLKNGDYKNIEDVVLGDDLFEGGTVYGTMQFMSDDMYEYMDVKVTGKHAVKEANKWVRVEDSKFAKKVEGEFLVYNLNSSNHIIIANETIFADYDETDHGSSINDAESLEVLNGKNIK